MIQKNAVICGSLLISFQFGADKGRYVSVKAEFQSNLFLDAFYTLIDFVINYVIQNLVNFRMKHLRNGSLARNMGDECINDCMR